MADPRVALLNDTDVDGYHFGCHRVMSIIRAHLAQRGLTEIGALPVGVDWRVGHRELLRQANLLIINGEGTLHHGSRKGRWLLEAGAEAKKRGAKVALINALWQDNPADWTQLVANFDVLSCRDSRSAAALSKAIGRQVTCLGDLSMSRPIPSSDTARSGLIIGDSVHAEITGYLARLADQMPEASLVPVTRSLKFVSPALTGLRRSLRTAYARLKERRYLVRHPQARFLPDEAAYIALLQTKALSITGRFHAACIAVACQTPFVAVRSNSWKIDALIDDIGLSAQRLQPLHSLTPNRLSAEDWAYSAAETQAIYATLNRWQTGTEYLFDDIRALVG